MCKVNIRTCELCLHQIDHIWLLGLFFKYIGTFCFQLCLRTVNVIVFGLFYGQGIVCKVGSIKDGTCNSCCLFLCWLMICMNKWIWHLLCSDFFCERFIVHFCLTCQFQFVDSLNLLFFFFLTLDAFLNLPIVVGEVTFLPTSFWRTGGQS